MPQPRKRLVSLSDTPYYHCISRCVRRAFLCGIDPSSGFDFSHRRGWIVDRIQKLVDVFAIDLCAYAVMNNHYHVVIRVDREQALSWSDTEVAERWLQLFTGPAMVQRFVKDEGLSEAELDRVKVWIDCWRERLYNLSWFMRCLNEPIARMANQEDHCRGRFWEGRFRSQALLDERALLTCMAYVDLNPIRAAIATTPETSDFTSIQERIIKPDTTKLKRFCGNADEGLAIPFAFNDYLQMVEWAGRALRSDKKGFIPSEFPSILQRLGMEQDALLKYVGHKPQHFHTALGSVARLRLLAQSVGLKFIKGISLGRRLYPEPG